MICEIVRFTVRPGTSREEVLADARSVAPRWQGEKELLRKHFIYDGDCGVMGIYLWNNREAAEAAHDAAWRQRCFDVHGSKPEIEYHETIMIVDNTNGTVTEY